MGSTAFVPSADAAERNARTAQARATAQPAQRPAANRPTASRPTTSRQNAARANVTRQTSAVQRRQASRSVSVAVPSTAASRSAPIAQQVSTFGVMRQAHGAGAGTPILPVSRTSGLSCVPFARMATGMEISGDARHWWNNAGGRYARGQAPERGAVLAFTASGGMSRGHVAVVSRVAGPRTIHIDHSNWGGPGIRRGTVMRGVVVMDVSDRNDWTAVRVQVGHDSSSFGRTYPTHGFIYNRPAGTRMMTAEAPRYIEVADAASPHAAQHQRLAEQLLAR
ncbi:MULTISPECIES: CHAP domain-containing protein [Roseomonadaceae]|uniref:CHAP domain-containing protein n=1 Tax=Roseomonadaceae TaxID=3385906 RepID=UPI001E459B2B|nr:CHAP domain-containing protein [Roseomonas oleicola]